MAMLLEEPAEERPLITVIPDVPEAEREAVEITKALREAGIVTDLAFKGNAKRRFELATKRGSVGRLVVSPNMVRDVGPADRQGISIRVNQPDSYEAGPSALIDLVLGALERTYTVVRHERAATGFAVDAVLQSLRS